MCKENITKLCNNCGDFIDMKEKQYTPLIKIRSHCYICGKTLESNYVSGEVNICDECLEKYFKKPLERIIKNG